MANTSKRFKHHESLNAWIENAWSLWHHAISPIRSSVSAECADLVCDVTFESFDLSHLSCFSCQLCTTNKVNINITQLTLSLPIPLRLYTLPYWSNPPVLIFDIRALWRSGLSARAPECRKLKMVGYTSMALNPLNSSNLEQLALKGLMIGHTNK